MKQLFMALIASIVLLSACLPSQAADQEVIPPSMDSSTESPPTTPTLDPHERPPSGAEREFNTDFSKHNVPYSDILSGGPPKDGIPALRNPALESIEQADAWLKPNEPVISVVAQGVARAYPIQILTWHEIVNDTIEGEPLLVTFCPLCNTAIAFRRTINGQVLEFGTTGRLRFSNLIMYDRQTESWWQQATGEAIAGEYTGTQLDYYQASIISWESFKSEYPDAQVLSRKTGYDRNYGRNPYVGYDDVNNTPFLYRGTPTPNQLVAMARVLTVDLNGEVVAYPYDTLMEARVANDSVGGEDIVVFWQAGVASALDQNNIAAGKDAGTAIAYSRILNGQTLTFIHDGLMFRDDQTDSTWTIFGESISGELAGSRLKPVVAVNHFWFSWAAFKPDTRIYTP